MKSKIQPLNADPKRQATHIIGGYVYQIWQSLYSWIHLKDGEVLLLEGAEDIDHISSDAATTTQVKCITSKNVTLNSSEITEAISNYWKLRQKETREIRFEFLTTAQRGQERANPFKGQKGLDYWDRCRNGYDMKPLRDFLATISSFPRELKEFIKTSTDDDFLNKLIKPIYWLTGEENLENLRKKAEDCLILHGEKGGFSANDSKNTAVHLVDMLWTKVIDKEISHRVVGRADFLMAFEGLLKELVSKSELRMMRETMSRLMENVLNQQSGSLSKNSSTNIINTAIFKPHIVDKSIFILRGGLVTEIATKINTLDIILIRGSSGMGKSVLSLQVVEATSDQWERITFRGLKGNNINQLLNGLYNYYSDKPNNILLDDINFNDGYQEYSDAFERLVNLLISHKKKIIVTSQKQLPQQLSSKLNFSSDNDFVVPKFNKDEIKSLLLLNSCPKADVDFWVKDIEFTTKSHPQLAHARVRRLKGDGWNKSKVIFKTEELTKVKHEVVSNLVSEIPSPEARNMLLRLSILSGSFKRKNAFALAKYPPEITTPGAIFNQLVGPYVEQDTEDSFRLSPLLENASKDNFSEIEIKTLHQLAGESYLSRTLTPSDLSNIFLHGIVSGSGRIMSFAFAAFQSIDSKHMKLIYPYLEWIMFVHIGTNKSAFENDQVLNLMFRYIQFVLAVETGNVKSALNIADVWFTEVKAFRNIGPFQKEDQARLLPFMFFLCVFKNTSLQIPISKCIEWIIGAYDFIKKNPEINSTFKKPLKWEISSWKELIPEVALIKRINPSNIEEFMSSIINFSGGAELLSNINSNDILPQRIVDNMWLDEIDKKNPNWQLPMEALAKLRSFSIERKAFNITALAIRAIAIIKKEYVNDPKGAKEELLKGIKQIGKHLELINYQAKIAFIDRDYKSAVKIWESILPNLSKQKNLSAAFSYRDLAVSFANLGDWTKAASNFKLASDCAKKHNQKMFGAQCLADYGFALWKLGEYADCVKVFADVIDTFPHLPNPKTNLTALGLLKMTSNSLIYFKKVLNPRYRNVGIPYTEPFAGSHSQLQFSEKLRELPVPPHISLWIFLAEVEQELNVGQTAFLKLKSLYNDLPILFQVEAKKIEIEMLLKTGDLSNIIENTIDFFVLMKITYKEERRSELIQELTSKEIEDVLGSQVSNVLSTLATVILSFVAKYPYDKLPFDLWEKSAEKYGLNKYREWDQFIEASTSMTIKSAREIINNGNAEGYLRLLASIYILANDEDRDYALYAGALLTSSIKSYSIFSGELNDYLVELLVKRWTEISSYLQSMHHDEDSKLVLSVCADTKVEGIKKAARIVLAANEICFRKIDSIKGELENIANS